MALEEEEEGVRLVDIFGGNRWDGRGVRTKQCSWCQAEMEYVSSVWLSSGWKPGGRPWAEESVMPTKPFFPAWFGISMSI